MNITQKQIDKLAHEVGTTQKELDLGTLPHGSVLVSEGRIQGIKIACRLLGIEDKVFKKKAKNPTQTKPPKINWKVFDTALGCDMLNDFAVGNYSFKAFCEFLEEPPMGAEIAKMKKSIYNVAYWRKACARAHKRLTGQPVQNLK